MAHTKGPWTATGTKALGLSEVIAPEAEYHEGYLVGTICQHYYAGPLSVRCWLPREQFEANARLIAAAPTMYSALELVLTWLANANTAEPSKVAASVINALQAAGYPADVLDVAALAMLKGAAHQ